LLPRGTKVDRVDLLHNPERGYLVQLVLPSGRVVRVFRDDNREYDLEDYVYVPPKPLGIKVKWTATVAKNHRRVRDRCLASKPKCTSQYTKGQRVRKCWRECEELATRTVNRAKRTAAAAKKKSGRKKTARA